MGFLCSKKVENPVKVPSAPADKDLHGGSEEKFLKFSFGAPLPESWIAVQDGPAERREASKRKPKVNSD